MSAWRFSPAPFLLAGPCVVEEGDLLVRVAERLAQIGQRLGVRVCLKASYDKANRSRAGAPRGPGLERGLELLARARRESGLPVVTDVHEAGQAASAAEVADVLQVPAFLCRQTDLLLACGKTGRPVNVKKGQWMQPEGMRGALELSLAPLTQAACGRCEREFARCQRGVGGHKPQGYRCAADRSSATSQ